MYIVAGRPGMGKTSVALNYARGAAQAGHGVLFFSLEMSADDLAGKAISEASFSGPEGAHVPHVAIERRNLTDRQRHGMSETIEFLDTLPLEIIDDGGLTIGRIRARVRSVKRQMKARGQSLDLVMIDYLQLVNPDRPTRSIVETVTEVSKGLKAIAMSEGVAIMALAQLSRVVESRPDKRPIMSDLRERPDRAGRRHPLPASRGILPAHVPARGRLRRARGMGDEAPARGRGDRVHSGQEAPRVPGTAFGRFHGVYQAVR
jgi:replicative DNA helicase